MNSFVIRKIELRDVDAVLALFDDVAAERLYIGTEPGYDRESYRARFEQAAGANAPPVFVACDGDKVVGQIGIFSHEVGPTIGMMVAASHRGHGIGRLLLDAAFAWARENEFPALNLFVFPHNERALRLYRSYGFEEIHYWENDVVRQTGEVWDTIHMRRTTALR